MKITLEVHDVSDKMFLREHVATGEVEDGKTFNISRTIGDGSMMIEMDKKQLIVYAKDIIRGLYESACGVENDQKES